jgi:FAD:protein FMN transferase
MKDRCIPSRRATLFLLCMLAACTRTPEEIALSGPSMGTTYTIKIVRHSDAIDTHQIEQSVERILAAVDQEMSTYRPDSEISRFNDSDSKDWFAVSADLAQVAVESQRIAALSRGAFDITVAPLVNLWGFGTSGARTAPPSRDEIATALALCGYRHLDVRLSPAALRKDLPGLHLDLNGIAPGYAVDLLAKEFVARGLTDFSIELGGEIQTRGHRADGTPWRVAIEHPLLRQSAPYAVVNLSGEAISTSGDYRQFFSFAGLRYSHTIDPATGRPVAHALTSIVIVRPTTAEADGLSTALMVLGPEEGFTLAKDNHWAALFLVRSGTGVTEKVTPEFAQYRRKE